jgi:hypothetical protein
MTVQDFDAVGPNCELRSAAYSVSLAADSFAKWLGALQLLDPPLQCISVFAQYRESSARRHSYRIDSQDRGCTAGTSQVAR